MPQHENNDSNFGFISFIPNDHFDMTCYLYTKWSLWYDIFFITNDHYDMALSLYQMIKYWIDISFMPNAHYNTTWYHHKTKESTAMRPLFFTNMD